LKVTRFCDFVCFTADYDGFEDDGALVRDERVRLRYPHRRPSIDIRNGTAAGYCYNYCSHGNSRL